MDKSVDNKINQLHPSKILDEMGISWNDDVEKKTSSLYKKVSSVIPDIEWPFFAPYIEAINILKKEYLSLFLENVEDIMEYKESSQYISDNLKKTENPRIISP